MALSHGMISLGRFVLIFLLFAKLVCIYTIFLFSFLLGRWPFILGILLILAIVALHLIQIVFFYCAWKFGERHYYSYSWFGYTFLLITDIIVVFIPNLLVVNRVLFGRTIFVTVLCITPFILLLFLNTAGEGGTEFHGESGWLFATMSVQIFDAIDMVDTVLNYSGNGAPNGLGLGMISLASGCLLLAAWEFLELAHHSPGSENGAKAYRLIGLILVNLATLIIRVVVYVDYGWRETTSITKNIIMICTSVSELRRCIGQISL